MIDDDWCLEKTLSIDRHFHREIYKLQIETFGKKSTPTIGCVQHLTYFVNETCLAVHKSWKQLTWKQLKWYYDPQTPVWIQQVLPERMIEQSKFDLIW